VVTVGSEIKRVVTEAVLNVSRYILVLVFEWLRKVTRILSYDNRYSKALPVGNIMDISAV
jgi:hypothetical protein